jgi:hypothetical protein
MSPAFFGSALAISWAELKERKLVVQFNWIPEVWGRNKPRATYSHDFVSHELLALRRKMFDYRFGENNINALVGERQFARVENHGHASLFPIQAMVFLHVSMVNIPTDDPQ